MKAQSTVHISNLERGDALNIKLGEYTVHGEDWEGPQTFGVTVAYTHKTVNFGWVLVVQENIGPEKEDTFYMSDDWEIRTPDGLAVYA